MKPAFKIFIFIGILFALLHTRDIIRFVQELHFWIPSPSNYQLNPDYERIQKSILKFSQSKASGDTAEKFVEAAQNGREEEVRVLLLNGIDPNVQNQDGNTALMGAAAFGYSKILTLLLQSGADPLIQNRQGKTASALALESGRKDVVELIFEHRSPKGFKSDQVLPLTINPVRDLNGISQRNILEWRKTLLARYPRLMPEEALRSDVVFGKITDGKLWMPIKVRSNYLSEDSTVQSVSGESRFVNNPYLLLGLIETKIPSGSDPNIDTSVTYPELTQLLWAADKSWAVASYDVSSYWRQSIQYGKATEKSLNLLLENYNARDYGFEYAFIVPDKTEQILFKKSSHPFLLSRFLYADASCGYTEGCNVSGPDDPNLHLTLTQTPATLCVKLWKKRPLGSNQKPDMLFLIEING